MKKIFIIDAVNYLFRSYYAIGPMTNNKGESTSALFGFIRSVKKLIKDFEPNYLVCVFDGPDNKKERQEVYAEYKMHRKKAPDDLYSQFGMAFDFCNFSGIPVLCVEGVEADDTMATIAKWAREKEEMQVYLCTSDKDLFQMVDKKTFIVLAHKDNLIVDEKKVKEIFGVAPDQIVDYLAIAGDSSDNIPGLPGFGPKTAADLLQRFQTLDEILKHPEKLTGKKRETMIKEQDKAILSRELVRLNFKVDVPHKKEFYALKEPDKEKLTEFYQKMNFSKFLHDLGLESTTSQRFEKPKKEEIEEKNYLLVDSEQELDELIALLLKEKELCIDTETTSQHPMEAGLVGIGLGVKPKKAWYLPFNANISKEAVLKAVGKLILSQVSFYGHNIKYDLQVLKNYGIALKNISFDTILASYLLNPQNRRHNLDQLSLEYFNKIKIEYDDLIKKDKKKIPLIDVPIEKVSEYCCEDVDYTIRLKDIFKQEIKTRKLEKVLYEIEIPLIEILAKMERAGIFIDVKKFKHLEEEFSDELQSLEKKIFKDVGEEFNLNSPKQLSEVLFKKLNLPLPKRQKTEYSTGADILEKLALDSPIVKQIMEHRTLQKLLSTYVQALPKQINKKTGRIHPTFNQSVTATGRLSCQDPNLQNIPVRGKEGIKIRRGFCPEKEGWSYFGADYSQIELRLLAHFSEDDELLAAFHHNKDIHAHTASLVYRVPLPEVTEQMRSIAKAVNFGIIYGLGPYGLSQQINIPYKEAQEFIKTYFERYKKVSSFIEKCKKEAEKTKMAVTLFGRQRPIPEIDNVNQNIRLAAQRLAVNTPLQGTVSDLIKLAMIEIDKDLTNLNLQGYLILQIHDELIFEVPDDEISHFKKLVKERMEKIVALKVPLVVQLQVGKNWGEC